MKTPGNNTPTVDTADRLEAQRQLLEAIENGAAFLELAELAATWAQTLLAASGATVTVIEEGEVRYVVGLGQAAELLGRRMPAQNSFTGKVAAARRAQIFRREGEILPPSRSRAERDNIGAGIVAPILAGGEVVGTLGVTAETEGRFDDSSRQAMTSLAEFVAAGYSLERRHAADVAEREKAEAASRAKSDFLVKAAHELKTPLNAIMGMSTLLLDGGVDREQREMLSAVRSAADTMLKVANDLVDFSRIETGRMHLEHVPFDVASVVEDCAALLAPGAFVRGVEMVCRIKRNFPIWVMGDPDRVRQILTNLLANAVKFTRQGEIVARMSGVATAGESARVRFEVVDTGPGIDAEKRETLFSERSMAERALNRRYGGTGMGLPICKRLVHQMEGEIGVESTEGQGSTFWFEIPFEYCKRAPYSSLTLPVPPMGNRILVVDDNRAAREALAAQLSDAHLDVVAVGSAAEALARVRAVGGGDGAFDLAIVDIEMPGEDGIYLGRELRRDPQTAELALMGLVSPWARATVKAEHDDLFLDLLGKPVRRLDMLEAVERALRRDERTPSGSLVFPDGGKTRDGGVSAPSASVGRGTVLIADSNLINQRVLTRMLRKLGYEPEVVTSGPEAVAAVARGEYALLLLDVQVPQIDGYQTALEIRQREGNGPRLPIVAITGGLAQQREQALLAGMNGSLARPITLADLKSILGELELSRQ